MGTNIDYTYHPPIDIGVHTRAPAADVTTPPFREHLTSFANTASTNAAEKDVLPTNNAAGAPAGHERRAEERQESADDQVATASDSNNSRTSGQDEDGRAQGDDATSTSDTNSGDEALLPTREAEGETSSASLGDGTSNARSAKAATNDLNTEALPQRADNSASAVSSSEDEGQPPDGNSKATQRTADERSQATEAHKQNASKTAPAGGVVSAEARHAKPVTKGEQLPAADEATKVNPAASKAQAENSGKSDIAQATSDRVARDKRTNSKRDATSVASKQADLRPANLGGVPERQIVTELREGFAQADDEAKPASAEIAPKATTKTAADTPITEVNSAASTVSSAEKTASDDRLPSALSASRPGGNSQAPLTESQQSRLVQRVAKAFDIARARGESSVRLRLTPPHLGSLNIELQVEGGNLTARLEVESQTARDALLENLNTLRNRLSEQNIRVDQFDVDVLDQRPDEQWSSGDRRNSEQPERNNESQDAARRRDESNLASPSVTTELLIDDSEIDVII